MAEDNTRELRTQQELTAQISRNLTNINRELSNQLRVQQLVNQASQQQALNASQVAQISDDALRAAGVNTAAYTGAATTGLEGVSAAAADQSTTFTQAASAASGAVTQMATTYDQAIQLMSTKAKGPLRDAYSELQEYFGGLMGPGGITADVDSMSNEMVGKFRDINLEVRGELYNTSEEFKLFGLPLGMAIGDLSEVMDNFNEVALRQGVINGFAMMNDATAETAIELKLFGDAMGMNAEQTSTFIQRQISLTGKAGTDMLKEAAVMAKQMEKATGISSKVIGFSIERIVQDTKNFGNVTVEEAARMSAALTQLGVGYDDLAGMVGKFQAFDSAVSSVSALTTVFGIQIDSMEMMKLANEDQEQFLRRMRDSFLQAGRSAETMTLPMKRLVAEQLGLADVESVERLLDPTKAISSMEELTSATAAAPDKAREVMDLLQGDILDLQDVTKYSTDQVRTFIEQGVRQPFVEAQIEAEQAASKIAGSFTGAIGTGQANAMQAMADALQDVTGIDPNIVNQLESGLAGTATQIQEIMSQITGGDFSGALDTLTSKLSELDIGGSMMSGVTSAVGNIETAFRDMANNIIQSLKDAGVIPNSPEDILTETLNRVGFTAQHTGEVWTESMAQAGISTENLATQLNDMTSVYSKLGKELGYLGLTYEQLSADQKQEMAERLKITNLSQEEIDQELQMIMSGQGATEGRLQKSREEFATNLISYYKAQGQDMSDFSDDFITTMEQQHGINRETLASTLEEGADIEGIVQDAAKAKAKKEEATTSGTSSTSSRGREERARTRSDAIAKSQTEEIKRTNAILEEIQSSNEGIIAGIDQLVYQIPYDQTIVLNIDGRKITDAVLRHPQGTDVNGQVTTTT